MGAWDFGSFDNDDARDWLYELEESSDMSVIESALLRVTEIGDEYLEAPDCCNAIAAAEVIAAIRGYPVSGFPKNAMSWVEKHPGIQIKDLILPALTAIERVRTKSELQELWDGPGKAVEWHATLDDLVRRLNI